jgi:hypothetical protein
MLEIVNIIPLFIVIQSFDHAFQWHQNAKKTPFTGTKMHTNSKADGVSFGYALCGTHTQSNIYIPTVSPTEA